jgi:hypothetical protein
MSECLYSEIIDILDKYCNRTPDGDLTYILQECIQGIRKIRNRKNSELMISDAGSWSWVPSQLDAKNMKHPN